MDTSQIYSSGILKKGEELLDANLGRMKSFGNGVLTITNKRLLFLQKPGFFSKGFHVSFECSLGSIVSITITGLISKQLNVQYFNEQTTYEFEHFKLGSQAETEIILKKLIGAKDEFKEKKTIEAKRVIIEEGNKDDAAEILKKRLARGEITKEEFHDKIQRT